jgi:hypothetical protein
MSRSIDNLVARPAEDIEDRLRMPVNPVRNYACASASLWRKLAFLSAHRTASLSHSRFLTRVASSLRCAISWVAGRGGQRKRRGLSGNAH